jgi:hypothetical protein
MLRGRKNAKQICLISNRDLKRILYVIYTIADAKAFYDKPRSAEAQDKYVHINLQPTETGKHHSRL